MMLERLSSKVCVRVMFMGCYVVMLRLAGLMMMMMMIMMMMMCVCVFMIVEASANQCRMSCAWVRASDKQRRAWQQR